MKLQQGQAAPDFNVLDIFDTPISLQDYAGQKLLISFYRFASCPFCNLRVHKLIQQLPEFSNRGLNIISFWQSPKESIRKDVGRQQPPFPLIPDPKRHIYQLYGLERSKTAVAKAILFHFNLIVEANQKGFHKKEIDGDMEQIPADFLINPDGTIHQAYYGTHVGDHLPFSAIRAFLEIDSQKTNQPLKIIGK